MGDKPMSLETQPEGEPTIRRSGRTRRPSVKTNIGKEETNRKTTRNNKRKTQRDTNRRIKRGIDKGVKILKKMKISFKKMTTGVGIKSDNIKKSLDFVKSMKLVDIKQDLKKNIQGYVLKKIFGINSTKIVRDILEVPASPGSVQGPVLYGCGSSEKTPKLGGTSSWFLPEDLKNTGLVYCWGTLVPCAFKQGKNSGLGINHEMEHVIPCVIQFFINCLAQRKNLTDSEETKYRKHHSILIDYILDLGYDKAKTKSIALNIMKLLRRQQVILGLPSISMFNQIKCQKELININIDINTFSLSLSINDSVVDEIVSKMDSFEAKGMTEKEGNISFMPCGWCGINNQKSAFFNEEVLRQYYTNSNYQGDEELIERAVREAIAYKTADKGNILREQCNKICEEYNKLNEFSPLILSSSIIILTTIMKTCFDELGVSNDSAPELYKWCAKAKDIFRESLSLLDGRDEDITKLCYDLGIQSNNVFTKEYLDMKDTTVSDLIRMGGGAEKVLTRQDTPIGEQRVSVGDRSMYLRPEVIEEARDETMGDKTLVFKDDETERMGVDFEPEPEEQSDIIIAEDKSGEYTLNEYSFRSVYHELLTLFPDDNAFLIMLNLVEGIDDSEYDTDLYEELFSTGEFSMNEYEELLYNKITNTINECVELDYEIEESQAQSKKRKTKRKSTKKSRRKKKRKTTRKKKKQSDLIDKIIDRLGY